MEMLYKKITLSEVQVLESGKILSQDQVGHALVKKDGLVHELELYDDRDEVEDGDSDDEFDDDDYGRVQLKNPERQWKKNQVKQNTFNQLLLNKPNLTKLSIGRLFYSVPYLDYLVGIDNSQLLTWIEEIVVQGETFSGRDYRQLAFRAFELCISIA